MGECLVSICCITYNHEPYIRDSIEGFLKQKTSFCFEILIHDDASTDRTADIIREYERQYPELIHPIYQKENQYSKGIKVVNPTFNFPRARGKYVALCEGDDYWTDPYKLQKQVDEMERHPDCHISFHPAKRLNHQTGEMYTIARHHKGNKIINVSEIIKANGSYSPTASLCLKREVIKNIPSFLNTAPVGDYFLMVLGAIKGGALYIDEAMSVYRTETGTAWRDSMEDVGRKREFLIKMHDSMIQLDQYLDKRYHVHFQHSIAKRYSNFAFKLLLRRDFKGYKKYIETSHELCRTVSWLSSFMYVGRYFPSVILAAVLLKQKVKKLLLKIGGG